MSGLNEEVGLVGSLVDDLLVDFVVEFNQF
jgi:hypothetical protein